jgi:hypothetical protein
MPQVKDLNELPVRQLTAADMAETEPAMDRALGHICLVIRKGPRASFWMI